MTAELAQLLEWLRQAGWEVVLRDNLPLSLGAAVLSRYRHVPEDYRSFLKQVAVCINPGKTGWFLCEDDYNGNTPADFHWDSWERLSLEALAEDQDEVARIRQFWDEHFPIMFSLRSGYAYLAIALTQEDYGRIVYGYEPEFEEVSVLCQSFSELVTMMTRAVIGEEVTWIVEEFVGSPAAEVKRE